jgi:hypothetical protein
VSFLVIGLSHIFQPGAWVEFFTKLRSLGRPDVFAEGFISLNFGAVIVSFHNVWSGPAVVLTLIGWGQVLKALFRFVAPAASLRLYERISPERAWQFRAGRWRRPRALCVSGVPGGSKDHPLNPVLVPLQLAGASEISTR